MLDTDEKTMKKATSFMSSPETDEMRCPDSTRNSAPFAFTGLSISNTWSQTSELLDACNAYLSDLRTATARY